MVYVRFASLRVPSFCCRSPWPLHRLNSPSQLPRTCARWHSIPAGSKEQMPFAAWGAGLKNNQPNRVRPNSTATPRPHHHYHHHHHHHHHHRRGRSMYGVRGGGDGGGGWVGGGDWRWWWTVVVVGGVNDSDDGDVVRDVCLLCGWMEITVWLVTTHIPPRPTGWASRTYHEQPLRV